MAYSEIRSWAEQLPEAEIFTLDDIQKAFPDKTRNALKTAASRLTTEEDPLVARITRGWYCRRHYQGWEPRPLIPIGIWREFPWLLVAGRGPGISGPEIVNIYGWSTQMSPRSFIAVVGRPPKSFTTDGLIYFGRSNRGRLELNVLEVSLLEAVRMFDTWSEVSWKGAMKRHTQKAADGLLQDFRPEQFLEVAKAEKGLGKQFLSRCHDMATSVI